MKRNHKERHNKFNADKFIDSIIAFILKHEDGLTAVICVVCLVFIMGLVVLTYKDSKEHPDIDYSYEYDDVTEFINGYDITNIEVSYNDDDERIVKVTRLADGSEESKDFHGDVFEYNFMGCNVLSKCDSPDGDYHIVESTYGKKKYFSLYYPAGYYSDRNKAAIKSN